jgi:hypothetical protein
MVRRPCASAFCFVLLTVPSLARAGDPAAAEALFRQGIEAMAQKDYVVACDKFAESERLDPGAGTLANLADCQEKSGKLATAWQSWHDAIDKLPPGDEAVGRAQQRVAQLEGRLPRLTIRLLPGAPSGTRVLRDGTELGPASLGAGLPLDPGPHEVVVKAPGRVDRSYPLPIGEGEHKDLNVEAGAAPPLAPLAAAVEGPAAPEVGKASFLRQHRVSLVLGTGAVAFGVAAGALGGVTWSSYSALAQRCGGTAVGCSSSEIDGVNGKATATNALFVTAGVAAVAAVVVFFVAERPRKVDQAKGQPGEKGLAFLSGRF